MLNSQRRHRCDVSSHVTTATYAAACVRFPPLVYETERERERDTGYQSVSDSLALSVLSVNQICVWQSVLARLFACVLDVAIEEARSEVPSAHHSTA